MDSSTKIREGAEEMKRDKDMPADDVLEDFFAAARQAAPEPSVPLLNAILADAAEVAAETKAAAPPGLADRRRAAGMRSPRGGFLGIFGGWRAAAVLILCGAIGFTAGATGTVGLAGEILWGAETDTITDVTEVFDLALAGG